MKAKSKRLSKFVVFGLLGAACTLTIVLFALRRGDVATDVDSRRKVSSEVRKDAARFSRNDKPSVRRAKPQKPVLDLTDDDEDDQRTPEEKALAERIEKALDDEDFELAASCAEEAQKCNDSEIRQAMVDTLGWFGERALPELTPFLADADDDVREGAMNEWTMALSSIEDEGIKVRSVELAMGVLKDEDALEEISNEYIGVDEKLAVESLVRIIEGGGSEEGVEKAKETYEFVTGDEWTDVAEAERWIAEEYEPPEEP